MHERKETSAGDLFDLDPGRLTEHTLRRNIATMAMLLLEMQHAGGDGGLDESLVHSDIKLDNILFHIGVRPAADCSEANGKVHLR